VYIWHKQFFFPFTMLNQSPASRLFTFILAAAGLGLSATGRGADTSVSAAAWTKPAWLTDLSLGAKESYDDNVLAVSGLGMPEQSSWVNDLTLKFGLDLAPVFAAGSAVQAFSLVYQPDKSTYAQASTENNTSHRINDAFKGKVGNLSYSLDNAFL
jgi:hypothetical protein